MSEIGHIDCGFLALVQAQMDAIWTDPIQKADKVAETGAIRAILANQQVNFSEITGAKDKSISLEWLTDCNASTDDCGDDCIITGDDASPICKSYTLRCLQESSFKIPVKAYRSRTIEPERALAELILYRTKALDEWVDQYVIAGIIANLGVNAWDHGQGDVVGTTTYIPASYWDAKIFGYFNQVTKYNRFVSPYLIDGSNLTQLVWNAMKDAANADGKGAAAKVGTMPIFEDLLNMETLAPGLTFMLHKTAAAFVSKTYYPSGMANAISKAQRTLFSIPSSNIPGLNYDVTHQEICESNEYYDAFKITLTGEFLTNPVGCTATRTGMLQFECGSAPTN